MKYFDSEKQKTNQSPVESIINIERVTGYTLTPLIFINVIFFILEVIYPEDYGRPEALYYVVEVINIYLLTIVIVLNLTNKRINRQCLRWLTILVVLINIFKNSAFCMSSITPILFLPIILGLISMDSKSIIISSVATAIVRIVGRVFYVFRYVAIDYGISSEELLENPFSTMADILEIAFVLIMGVILAWVAGKMQTLLTLYVAEQKNQALINQDMSVAGEIQQSMLSNEFINEKEYSAYAIMNPARYVGGDFFDIVKLDDNKLAIVIADVSGKGVQAAMCMALSKALIKVYAQSDNSPDKILEKTNGFLNTMRGKKKLFVTTWVGILNLETGIMTYTNAGHNPVCIRRKGGQYEYIKSRVNFVIGARPLIKYFENQIKLYPGDSIFLYTDGVPETKNADGEFYTSDRMLEYLNSIETDCPEEIVVKMQKRLMEYQGDAEQYDDITMLGFRFDAYAEKKETESRSFTATSETLDEALAFIRTECGKFITKENLLKDIEIASSEVIANICMHAYKGTTGEYEIRIHNDGRKIFVSFADEGRQFNVLQLQTPDTTLKMSERSQGGLGIYIVKKLMNDVSYTYENKRNILTLVKEY